MSANNLAAANCTAIEKPNSKADSTAPAGVPVIDYEGSGYRQDFWEGQGREYEDAVERIALQRLLPPQGGRIAEIGAGFGRLADLYLGYDQIVLFDYSRTMLADAVRKWGHDPRFVFVAGNLYEMPLAAGTLDTLVMVRVMHHLADVPAALAQLQPLLHRSSTAVLEYANKRNLKAVLRWLSRRQRWSPFDPAPLEFVAMNFDFHPGWMAAKMKNAGLRVDERFGASHFRLPALKENLPAGLLARLDSRLFQIGGKFPLAPSIFVRTAASDAAERPQREASPGEVSPAHLFRCPSCAAHPLAATGPTQLQCPSCARQYGQTDRIWDFKLPA